MAAMTVAHPSAPVDAPDLESAMAAVREGGLRLTAARRLLLEALWEASEPLSAEELVDRLDGRSDPGSVYRNLEALERLGLIRHVHLGHGPGLYARSGLGPHEYVLCESCGAHLTVDPKELDEVRQLIRESFGYRARFSHFPVAGLCPRCARDN
jgi:Fur family transcriptional regulator, ferric uptake regulator